MWHQMRQIFIFLCLEILQDTEKLMSSRKSFTGSKFLKDTEEDFQNST